MSAYGHRIFLKVVEHESFVGAAESLHLTPPAISHAIAKMEKEYGLTLFYRDRNGARLTGDGRRILPYIQAILQDEERLKQEIGLIAGVESGSVCLATFNSVCINWVPDIISCFRHAHPQVEVNVCQSGYEGVLDWLRTGYADMGFVSQASVAGEDIEFIPLYRDRIMCITHKDFATKHPDRIVMEDIQKEPFVYQRVGYDSDTNALLKSSGISISNSYLVESDESIVALVEGGMGISLLPQLALKRMMHNGKVYPLVPESYRTIGLASLKNRPSSAAAKEMRRFILSYIEQTYGGFPDAKGG